MFKTAQNDVFTDVHGGTENAVVQFKSILDDIIAAYRNIGEIRADRA